MKNGLIENMVDASVQIQSNGVDLTIRDILIPWEKGVVDFDNSNRHISGSHKLPPSDDNMYHMVRDGAYIVRIKEKINLPKNIVGLIKARSSLLRSGAYIESAIWDAGYSGYGQVLLRVTNPYGLDLATNARICQMIFVKTDEETEGYNGMYQGEC